MKLRALIAEATKGPVVRVPQSKGGDLIAHPFETGNQMNPKGLRLIAFMMTRGDSLKEDEANAALITYLFNHADAIADLCEAAQGVVNTISSDCECDECKALRKALAAMGEI